MATASIVRERNPMDWYRLTESANSILNGIMAYTGREKLKEQKKSRPDERRLKELDLLFREVHAINQNTANFQSLERMEQLVEYYGPILNATRPKKSITHLTQQFRLSSFDFQAAQQEIIEQNTLDIAPGEQPTVIILGAQPGAGKTELEKQARIELNDNVVSCNADVFRDFHPEADEIMSNYQEQYPDTTAPFAQAWNNGLRAYCEAHRLNYILETS